MCFFFFFDMYNSVCVWVTNNYYYSPQNIACVCWTVEYSKYVDFVFFLLKLQETRKKKNHNKSDGAYVCVKIVFFYTRIVILILRWVFVSLYSRHVTRLSLIEQCAQFQGYKLVSSVCFLCVAVRTPQYHRSIIITTKITTIRCINYMRVQ